MEDCFFKLAGLGDIDFEDRLFLTSFPLMSGELIRSIKEIGVINPLILREKGKKFQIVSGFKRAFACRELKREKVKALVYSQDKLSDKEALYLNLSENRTVRVFNTVEIAMILERLFKHLKIDRKEYKEKFLPLLGIDFNEKQLKDCFDLFNLNEELRAYIALEKISFKNIFLWMRFGKGEQEEVFRLISQLRLSSNKLREVLLYLEEICQRDKVSVKDLVGSSGIQEVLKNEKLTVPQRTSRIRDILKKKRFPRLSSLEASLSGKLKNLGLPKGMVIRPPEFFEEEEFSLELRIKNREDLKRMGRSLLDISDRKEITDLFKID